MSIGLSMLCVRRFWSKAKGNEVKLCRTQLVLLDVQPNLDGVHDIKCKRVITLEGPSALLGLLVLFLPKICRSRMKKGKEGNQIVMAVAWHSQSGPFGSRNAPNVGIFRSRYMSFWRWWLQLSPAVSCLSFQQCLLYVDKKYCVGAPVMTIVDLFSSLGEWRGHL